MFTVNSNNIFGQQVEEAGTYNVEIVQSRLTKSAKGKDMVTIDYKVLDGDYQGAEIRYQNVTWDDSTDTAFNMSVKRFNTILVAIGVKDGVVINSVGQFAEGIMHKKLAIIVDWDEPNNKGNVYLTVKGYKSLDPEGSKPNGIKRPQDTAVPTTGGFGNGFGGVGQATQPRHIDPTAPIEPPAANGGFGNAAPQQATPDPFTNNNGQPIDISDDDLPF
ncbi:DUF669 domain-containing protein [Lacticaseibacillus saniviri]|uniref:DUF669 domain-containing protein n=1 Tax=Lacticaseibacillus saniviri TaxID=931533 RepID=UPI001EDDFD40|nr:DUF669 domain-containing protein [Lacticaseibacillus saniviri]MCG4280889.1 DUF669 domain-containing protein [Lacticaseibacillus saniviri]